MIVNIVFMILSLKAILSLQLKDDTDQIQINLVYSDLFKDFIGVYKQNGYKNNLSNQQQPTKYLKVDEGDEINRFHNPDSYENIEKKKENQTTIQAYVSIPEQNKHIQMSIFMGDRLQPFKLTFDLNYPYIWVKHPTCEFCQERMVNQTKNTSSTQLESSYLQQNSNEDYKNRIFHKINKELHHIQFDQQQALKNELFNCSKVKDLNLKGNYYSCYANNSTCHMLEQNQVISYSTTNFKNFSEDLNNQTKIQNNVTNNTQTQTESLKYLIGDKVNDAIGFQKDVSNVIFSDFFVIKKEVNVQLDDLLIQNDGRIGFPISKNQSIVQKLYDSKMINRNQFSLYLYYEPTNAIQPCIILGNNNQNYYQGDFNYTKMWNYENKYSIRFNQIKLGNNSIITQNIQSKNQTKQNGTIKKQIHHNYQQVEDQPRNKSTDLLKQEYIGIFSTQEFYIKFPDNVIKNLIKVMKDVYSIQCIQEINLNVVCLKQLNQSLPDLSIEVDHPEKGKDKQFIHLKSDWYIWECKQPQSASELQIFNQGMQQNITQLRICKTFFMTNTQISQNEPQNLYYFGFSFMERFYIQFDLDQETIAFSQSVRKSQLAAAIPKQNILLMVGPLTLIAILFYFFWYKTKQIQQFQLNQSQIKSNNNSNEQRLQTRTLILNN